MTYLDFSGLTEEHMRTIVRMVTLGIYPYRLKDGGGWTYAIDRDGLWYGTRDPDPDTKRELDTIITYWKKALYGKTTEG